MVGVDEVGRGCWAGPLLIVAARQIGPLPEGLRDSKLMTAKQREKMLDLLAPPKNLSGAVGNRIAEHQVFGPGLSNCCQFGEGWVEAREIDAKGLASALRLGVARALKSLGAGPAERVVMDGKVNYLPKKFINGRAAIKADSSVPIVSAASIYAKVTRDKFMANLAKSYPLYHFEKHVGYGTKLHKAAIVSLGPIRSVHRFSYAPIAGVGEALE